MQWECANVIGVCVCVCARARVQLVGVFEVPESRIWMGHVTRTE